MPVLVLMYHKTPVAANDQYDVSFDTFREQVARMRDAGVKFIRFSDVNHALYRSGSMHVAITFDDGHGTNERAFEFLAGKGITPAAFIVRAWSQTDRAFIPVERLRRLADHVDIGSHGATHCDLSKLSDVDLARELNSSRDYLEDAVGRPVDIMALPGGVGSKRVLKFAASSGYRLVGNSVEDIHRHLTSSINRVCVRSDHSAMYPLQLTKAPAMFWQQKRLKRGLSGTARYAFGDRGYAAVSGTLKRLLRSKL